MNIRSKLISWAFGQNGVDMARDFAQKFPGRCLICSYHYYGISHGHVDPGTPVAEHFCIETKRNKP